MGAEDQWWEDVTEAMDDAYVDAESRTGPGYTEPPADWDGDDDADGS